MRTVTFLCGLWACSLFGQTDLDSLYEVWMNKKSHDTLRIDAMNLYAWKGYIRKHPDSAHHYAQLAYNLALTIDDRSRMAKSLNTQAVSFFFRGDMPEAIDHYHQSLEIHKNLGNEIAQASLYANIGAAYRNTSDYDQAISSLEKSIALCKKHGLEQQLAKSYMNLANIYLTMSWYDHAQEFYAKSANIRNKLDDKAGQMSLANNLGIVNLYLGNNKEANDHFSKALKISRELGNVRMESAALANLGLVESQQGNSRQALKYYLDGLQIQTARGDKQTQSLSYNNIAVAFLNLRMLDSSIYYHNESVKLKEEIEDTLGLAASYGNIGNIHMLNHDLDSTLHYFQKGYDIFRIYEDQKGIALSLDNIALVYLIKHDFHRALNYSYQALDKAKKYNVNEQLVNSYRSIYYGLAMSDSVKKAIEFGSELFDLRLVDIKVNAMVLSEDQKNSFFKELKEDLEVTYTIGLIDSHSVHSANSYNLSLITKGLFQRSSTAMRNAILSSNDSVLTKQYHKWLGLKRKIADSYARGVNVDELEIEAEDYEKQLVKASEDFTHYNSILEIDWKNVRSNLNQSECAVEFVRFTERKTYENDFTRKDIYAALIITESSKYPKMVRLFEESELEKIIGTFPGNNISYIEQVYGSRKNTKSQLYDLIWKPMEEELDGAQKVFVSPVGLLHKISFAALAKEQDVFLCDLYDIETQSSTGKIALPNETAHNLSSTTTLFGGIDYNSDSTSTEIWNYLDGSRSETEQIEKILKKNKIDYNYFNHANATEGQFKEIASKSNILHIATHGFFYADPDEVRDATIDESETDIVFRGGRTGVGMKTFVKSRNPLMRSGLAFAGANDVWNRSSIEGEDGVLTAAEVATIDMRNTDLVVLSACETGLGDIKGSEGVYGLQRSFKMAGVTYIIMSLWQVPDKETAEFMTSFYSNLTKTKDIKKSFSLTQQEMRKKYDPYYWAAFVLVE